MVLSPKSLFLPGKTIGTNKNDLIEMIIHQTTLKLVGEEYTLRGEWQPRKRKELATRGLFERVACEIFLNTLRKSEYLAGK